MTVVDIKIRQVPGEMKTVSVNSGASVKEALEAAGLWPLAAGKEVRQNNAKVESFDQSVQYGHDIMVTAQVKGN